MPVRKPFSEKYRRVRNQPLVFSKRAVLKLIFAATTAQVFSGAVCLGPPELRQIEEGKLNYVHRVPAVRPSLDLASRIPFSINKI